MRNRVLKAATALAAFVPALALAQQRPAQQPAQRPAQPPAQRPAQPAQRPAAQRPAAQGQSGGIVVSLTPSVFVARDEALFNHLLTRIAAPGDAPNRYLPGGQASIGLRVSPKLAIGAGLGFGVSSGLTLLQPGAGFRYTFAPAARNSFYFIGAGQASMWSGNGPGEKATGIGGGGTLGIRRNLNAKTAFHLEGRVAYENYSEENFSAIVGRAGLGLSWVLGGGPARDTDGDGVTDGRDRCATTPRGATVDARGCPTDRDSDGVLDGIDRCNDTPRNTPVDATGCTRDTDRDGIADNADRCANTPAGTPVDATGCPRDADGDGVFDNVDRCANTVRGTPVGADGCPRDADGDGVNDAADRCPNTASGTLVDANGCPRDADGDGVHDGNDRCPSTAAGVQVDANGCPVARDTDADGVPDERDRCAGTPAGRRVDATGCVIAEELTRVGTALRLQNITFRPGTSRLTPASNGALNDVARQIRGVLASDAGARFEVGGHTDNRGAAATNRRLSQARAQAVATYLTAQGVPATALTAVGYGPDQAAAPNTTAAGRAQNRRVEIKRTN